MSAVPDISSETPVGPERGGGKNSNVCFLQVHVWIQEVRTLMLSPDVAAPVGPERGGAKIILCAFCRFMLP